MTKDILTISEAAALLGNCDLPTLRGWVRAGAIKAGTTPGGRLRFSASEVRRFRTRMTGVDD
jgi:excisionase family DNA binding protein